MENPIKIDDLGVPLFLETPILSFKMTEEVAYTLSSLSVHSRLIAFDISRLPKCVSFVD